MLNTDLFSPVPTRWVGPLHIVFDGQHSDSLQVPLATFESPLWPSVARGAKASAISGIKTFEQQASMTRSVLLKGSSACALYEIVCALKTQFERLQQVVRSTSSYCQLQDWSHEIQGSRLFLRFSFSTGQASGHNMTTKAADALIEHLLASYPSLEYVSISGNICTDKKNNAINAFLGRGRSVIAETTIPRRTCVKMLKTTPEAIVRLNHDKNYLGSILAGSLRSANAHFANMLLALYLALGQDAANIIEGSQGITFAELDGQGDLYFSVSLPHLIIGTHGNGKHLEWVQQNLETLGCTQAQHHNPSQRLAQIIAATVLCGELSLLAAQTCPGVLVQSHMKLERA